MRVLEICCGHDSDEDRAANVSVHALRFGDAGEVGFGVAFVFVLLCLCLGLGGSAGEG